MDTNKFIQFRNYRHRYAGATRAASNSFNENDFVLRYWEENKADYLTKLFGDELILSKEVQYTQSKDELEKKIIELRRKYRNFTDEYTIRLRDAFGYKDNSYIWERPDYMSEQEYSDFINIVHLFDTEYLATNHVRLEKPVHTIINGTRIDIQTGSKTMKVLSKICDALGLAHEFEDFRLAQSLITNQRKLTGTLHLSIHPMDYATASDNNNGWSSCMSWKEEGCYRLGTVEMMNSPMVVCAYLASNQVDMPDDDWNSKKWRAWLIVHPQFIFVNRHYPYHSDEIATEVLNWAKDIIRERLGWNYGEVVHDLCSYWENIYNDDWQYNVTASSPILIQTNYMYNDIGGNDILGCMSLDNTPKTNPKYQYEVNISGPANCMWCGCRIPLGGESGRLTCDDCGTVECAYCGCIIEGESYTTPDGDIYCESCYGEQYTQCQCCGDIIPAYSAMTVLIPVNKEKPHYWISNCVIAYVCQSCLNEYVDQNLLISLEDAKNVHFNDETIQKRWDENITDGCGECEFGVDEVYVLNPYYEWNSDHKITLLNLCGRSISEDYCCRSTGTLYVSRNYSDGIATWHNYVIDNENDF